MPLETLKEVGWVARVAVRVQPAVLVELEFVVLGEAYSTFFIHYAYALIVSNLKVSLQ